MELKFWEFLLWIPTILLTILIVFIPYLVFTKLTFSIKNKISRIVSTFVFSLIIALPLTFLMTYYSTEFSNDWILNKFGFDENGMNEDEYFRNVSSENLNRLKEIYYSQMGIGWPLKAIFACVVFTLPINMLISIFSARKKL